MTGVFVRRPCAWRQGPGAVCRPRRGVSGDTHPPPAPWPQTPSLCSREKRNFCGFRLTAFSVFIAAQANSHSLLLKFSPHILSNGPGCFHVRKRGTWWVPLTCEVQSRRRRLPPAGPRSAFSGDSPHSVGRAPEGRVTKHARLGAGSAGTQGAGGRAGGGRAP